MQAAANADTGSDDDAMVSAGAPDAALVGAIAVLAGGKLVFATTGATACGAPCGFTSSFLHIRPLEGTCRIFEVVGLEGGATQNLQDSTVFSVCKVE